MAHQHWAHTLSHVGHEAEKNGNNKLAGTLYFVVGFFLTPMLIGIPIMIYGLCKLCK